MDTHDADMQELVLKARLIAAEELIAHGKPKEAERLLKRTLKQAEDISDETNLLVAFVLLEMFDFYEKQGRHDEAKPIWSRMRKIVLTNVPESYQKKLFVDS